MTNITIEGSEDFQAEVLFATRAPSQINEAVWTQVQNASKQLKLRIRALMPVDYGDARDRWGNPNHIMRRPRYKGASGRGIWREDRARLSIEQGAELEPYEYIKRLNEGSSRQAPAGFIDITAEDVMDEFSGFLLTAVVEVFDE